MMLQMLQMRVSLAMPSHGTLTLRCSATPMMHPVVTTRIRQSWAMCSETCEPQANSVLHRLSSGSRGRTRRKVFPAEPPSISHLRSACLRCKVRTETISWMLAMMPVKLCRAPSRSAAFRQSCLTVARRLNASRLVACLLEKPCLARRSPWPPRQQSAQQRPQRQRPRWTKPRVASAADLSCLVCSQCRLGPSSPAPRRPLPVASCHSRWTRRVVIAVQGRHCAGRSSHRR
mmetsp:Transcript_98431/g.249847  ORF Transcript_98431/g.249847 Transcript_98431/m.249847 type:complete len:231 (-) Transcript_98431:893-1585(-)